MIAKRGIETGEDCDSVPESMRQYLALHWDPSKSRHLFNRGYGASDPMLNAPASSGKIGKPLFPYMMRGINWY